MLRRAILALPFLLLHQPALALAIPSPYAASFETVPQIECFGPKGNRWSGSGVRINDNTILTAAHVPSGGLCEAHDTTLHNTRFEPGQDVAFETGDLKDGFRAIVSCEGIKEGERYLAMGYADGGAPDVEPLIGTDTRDGQLTIMRGHVYHGMSGGAVLNDSGEVVAVINAMQAQGMPLAFVTPLTQTYLCKSA
jgi:S1-C subfamily serine protease